MFAYSHHGWNNARILNLQHRQTNCPVGFSNRGDSAGGRISWQNLLLKKLSFSTDVSCSLQDTDRKRLKHQGEPGVLARPRNGDRFDVAMNALAARNGNADFRLELHCVEMSPSAFRSCVSSRARLGAFGTAAFATGVLEINEDSVLASRSRLTSTTVPSSLRPRSRW